MSQTIDNRVVSLDFDNARFERNVSTSMSTLDKLKEKLNFKGAEKGLEELEAASEKVDMSGLGKAVDTVSSKFSALETVAVGALLKIGSQAVEAGEKLVKSLSIDQIAAGYQKYEKIVTSSRTILEATKDQGETMESVEKILEKLNWYSDETSYSLTDMTDNVGKFVNQGVKLQDAADVMMGIASAAALAGANSQQASRAMYNISQAMGVGYMSLIDWKSIENAMMATRQFKQLAINTAVSLGTLADLGNGSYSSLVGADDVFTLNQFNTMLTQGKWFTDEVIVEAYKQYGTFASELNAVTERTKIGATDMLDLVDMYKKGTLETEEGLKKLDKNAKESGTSIAQLRNEIRHLSADEYDLGLKSFLAAQQAKTFTEVINYTKDAVSSAWMKIFNSIFGNVEEATKLWTDMVLVFDDIFVSPASDLADVFKEWRELGGRDSLIAGVFNILNSLVDVLGVVKEAFREVFPPLTGERLKELTDRFKEFTEKLKMSEETAEKVKNTFKGIFGVLDVGWELIKSGIILLRPFAKLAGWIFDILLSSTGVLGKVTGSFSDFISETRILTNTAESIATFIENIPKRIGELFKALTGTTPKELMENSKGLFSYLDKLREFFGILKKEDSSEPGFFKSAIDTFSSVKTWFNGVWAWILKVAEKARNFFKGLDRILGFSDSMKTVWENVRKALGGANGIDFRAFGGTKDSLTDLVSKLEPFFDKVKNIAKRGATTAITAVKDVIAYAKQVWDNFDAKKLLTVMRGFRVFVNTFLKIMRGGAFTGILVQIAGVVKSFRKVLNQVAGLIKEKKKAQKYENIKSLATSFLMIAGGILAIAGAIKMLADIKDQEAVTRGAIAIGAILVAMGIFISVLSSQRKILGKDGISAFANRFDGNTMLKAAGAIAIMAYSLRIIAKAIKTVAGIGNGEIIITSAVMMLLLFGELFAAAATFGLLADDKKLSTDAMLKGAASIVIMSVAMWIVGKALKNIAKIGTAGQIFTAVGAMATALILLAGVAVAFGVLSSKMIVSDTGMLAAAASILIMAYAIKIISGPFKKLGKMEWPQIGRALTAMGGALLEMALIVGILGYISPFGAILAAASMLIMAKVLQKLTIPFMLFGRMQWDQIKNALAAMGLALLEMGLIAGLLGVIAPVGAIAGAITMLLMAKVLQKISIPFMMLGSMPFGNIVKALVALGGALVEMGVIAGLLGLVSPFAIVGALTMLLMAKTLCKIIEPIKELAVIKWSDILKSLLAMKLIFGVLDETVNGFVNPLGILQGFSFEKLANALDTIMDPIEKLSSIEWTSLSHALDAMDKIFTKMDEILDDSSLGNLFDVAKAAAFERLGDAIGRMAPAIKILTNLNQDAVSNVLDVLGTAFKDFADALDQTPWFYPTGRANGIGALIDNITKLTDVLPPFMDVVNEYGDLVETSLTTLGKGFSKFGEALKGTPWLNPKGRADSIGILIDNIQSLTKVLPGFMDLFDAYPTNTPPIGATMTEATSNASRVSSSLDILGQAFRDFGAALKESPFFNAEGKASAVSIVIGSINDLVLGLKNFMAINTDAEATAGAFETLSTGISKLGGAVKSFSAATTGVDPTTGMVLVESSSAKSFETTADALNRLASALRVIIPQVKDLDIGEFSEKLTTVSTDLVDFCEKLEGFDMDFGNFVENARTAAEKFVQTFKETVESKKKSVKDTILSIATESVADLRKKYDAFFSAGSYLMKGLEDGIADGERDVIRKVGAASDNVTRTANAKFGVKSPSKVFKEIGQYLDLGLVAGIEEYAYKVNTASSAMAEGAIEAATDPFNKYGDILDSQFGTTMTITPIMDLSQIERDRQTLSNAIGGLDIGASVSLANQAAWELAHRRSASDQQDAAISKLTGLVRDLVENPPSVNHNEFNISGADPDEVADKVEQRLTRDIVRRNAVWGS